MSPDNSIPVDVAPKNSFLSDVIATIVVLDLFLTGCRPVQATEKPPTPTGDGGGKPSETTIDLLATQTPKASITPKFIPTEETKTLPVVDLPPEVVKNVEARLEGYSVEAGNLTDINGNNTGLKVVELSNGMITLQMLSKLNGQSYIQTFLLMDLDGKTTRVKVLEDGCLDMPGQNWNPVTQAFEQKFVPYPVPGSKEIKILDERLESTSTFLQVLREITREYMEVDPTGELLENNRITNNQLLNIISTNKGGRVESHGLLFRSMWESTNHDAFSSNTILVWNQLEGKYVPEEVVRYKVITLGQNPATQYGYGVAEKPNGVKVEVFFDQKDANNLDNWMNFGYGN